MNYRLQLRPPPVVDLVLDVTSGKYVAAPPVVDQASIFQQKLELAHGMAQHLEHQLVQQLLSSRGKA
jgi:hypothetical protein